jgi:transcriptional regulator with XRE-family HTH domain
VFASGAAEPPRALRDPLQRFAGNLRTARSALGLTQEAVALAADMSQSYYGRIERGEVDPGVRTAARIARALNVTSARLYEGVEETTPSGRPG